jgi:ribonuclease Z
MRPILRPRLVNGAFEDPGLLIPIIHDNRALLLDLGDLHALTPREALKISHAFVSHTHMDHFVGFDLLLRLFLGRDKVLHLFGPAGILENVAGKLAAYTWNLVGNFSGRFVLHVTEVLPGALRRRAFHCRDGFLPGRTMGEHPFSGPLLVEPTLNVSAAILDHGIPCLGFRVQEPFHINILKEGLEELQLEPGPWLKTFKEAVSSGRDRNQFFTVSPPRGKGPPKRFALADLARRIARFSEGQKVAYIADAAYHPANIAKMVQLARGVDHLFIEAAFLHEDRSLARRKFHLTARQAGTVAALAGAKRMTVFHFSPRYENRGDLLREEARAAFAHDPSAQV